MASVRVPQVYGRDWTRYHCCYHPTPFDLRNLLVISIAHGEGIEPTFF
jgi:hypothetical protein